MRFPAVGLMALFLVGCTSNTDRIYYAKPGASDNEFARVKYDCLNDVTARYPRASRNTLLAMMDLCMRANGWVPGGGPAKTTKGITAWVAWTQHVTGDQADEWAASGTAPTKPACDQILKEEVAAAASVARRINPNIRIEQSDTLAVIHGNPIMTYAGICLPDTIDPRAKP